MVYAPFVTNHKLGNYETFRAGLHNSIKWAPWIARVGADYPEKVLYLDFYSKLTWKLNRFIYNWLGFESKQSILYSYHTILISFIDWVSSMILKVVNNKYILQLWKYYTKKKNFDWNYVYKNELKLQNFRWLLKNRKKKLITNKKTNALKKYKFLFNNFCNNKLKWGFFNYIMKPVLVFITFLSYIYECMFEYISDFFIFNNSYIISITEQIFNIF
jgi:hypothetical protein